MSETKTTSFDPFGRALFESESAKSLSRVGVIDVGSNSVRMVVFDGAARSPAYFYNEKVMCALGAGLSETGTLSPEGRIRALSAIKRFQALAKGMNLPPLTAVATAAVREATDGPDFCAEVQRETGLKIWVIDGQEEARLSAQGVLLGWPGSYGLVCDIGGSSMELADLDQGRVGRRLTSPLGPLKLKEVKGGKKGLKRFIKSVMVDLAAEMDSGGKRLFLVGGSWRAIARVDMERRGYPLTVLHEYRMTPKAIRETVKYIEECDIEELRGRCGISSARMALVPQASIVLKELVRSFKPKDITVSSYGIREGMLYEQMPSRMRQRDPLIEACQFAEKRDARVPGFGRNLYSFIRPLIKNQPDQRRRIIRAACLLHDVSWRAHPDYRAEVCFDNATRANLGGLKHSERIFLGLALLHRYRNQRDSTRFEYLYDLLDEKSQREAEIVGKAMRFGAMLWPQGDALMGQLKFYPKKKKLELILRAEAADLFGEVAQARFYSLAAALDTETKVKLKKAKS